MNEPVLRELQTTVHQRLGRFMLRVQRYEMLLKALVIDSIAFGTQQYFATFVQSAHFDDLLHGILPDGIVDWPNCTAVSLLRRQEEQTAPGQMTRLDTALEAIRATHPEHRPRKYFCQSWRDLLKRSGQFHIRKEKGSGAQQGITWYRSLGDGTN